MPGLALAPGRRRGIVQWPRAVGATGLRLLAGHALASARLELIG